MPIDHARRRGRFRLFHPSARTPGDRSSQANIRRLGVELLEDRRLLSASLGQPAIELFDVSPALFVENQGQWPDESVRYAFHGDGATVLHTDAGPVFQLFSSHLAPQDEAADDSSHLAPQDEATSRGARRLLSTQFSVTFDGAERVEPVGLDRAETVFNYFLGEQSNWRSNVPGYATVAYPGLYDGIDLLTFGRRDSLKYEFHVAPGADWRAIQISYEGIQNLWLDAAGALHVETELGELIDEAPYIYQEIAGQQVEVPGAFSLLDADTYTSEVTGPYDPSLELIIDPDLAWSTYLGGSGDDYGYGIAVDASGNALVTGETKSSGWTSGGYDTTYNGGYSDTFVAKIAGPAPIIDGLIFWDESGDGDWNDPGRWVNLNGDPVGRIPDETLSVIINNDTVTIPAGLMLRNLTVESGAIVLPPGAVLTVEENVEFAPDAMLVCQVDGAAFGRIDAGGSVELGGALEIQPVGVSGAALGSIRTQTIITAAGGVLGQFDSLPPVHGFRRGPSGHLGIGVFHKGTHYVGRVGPDDPASAVDVDLFFAQQGDSNGDGYVNGLDLNIVYCHMSQPGDPADRSWVLGDTAGGPIGRGDGYVDQSDLDDLVDHFTCGCIGGHVQTPAPIVVEGPAEVVGQHVFYNNSAFDGHDSAAGIDDDGAIAAGKTALRPGETVSAANYTNYSRGINGLMIDVDGLPEGFVPAAGDFLFRIGNDDLPGGWAAAPAPAEIVLREGAGDGGADRITIVWDDYAIQNQWLQVSMPGERLGLAEDDVFYFGNAVGETGNSATDARVTVADLLLTRNKPQGILDPAGVDCPYDFNRDGRVNATDVLLARNNQTNFLGGLKLLDLSSPQQSALAMEMDMEAPLSEMVWYAQDRSSSRPARSRNAAAETVDKLLATYWP